MTTRVIFGETNNIELAQEYLKTIGVKNFFEGAIIKDNDTLSGIAFFIEGNSLEEIFATAQNIDRKIINFDFIAINGFGAQTLTGYAICFKNTQSVIDRLGEINQECRPQILIDFGVHILNEDSCYVASVLSPELSDDEKHLVAWRSKFETICQYVGAKSVRFYPTNYNSVV